MRTRIAGFLLAVACLTILGVLAWIDEATKQIIEYLLGVIVVVAMLAGAYMGLAMAVDGDDD
jgi:cobalamin biosynthesis protein CobD/CbiB